MKVAFQLRQVKELLNKTKVSVGKNRGAHHENGILLDQFLRGVWMLGGNMGSRCVREVSGQAPTPVSRLPATIVAVVGGFRTNFPS
jgi:hypothetical protein